MDFVTLYRYLETWKLYMSDISLAHVGDMDILLEELRSIPHEAMLRSDYYEQLHIYFIRGTSIINKFYHTLYGETARHTIEKWEGRVRAACTLHGFGHYVHNNHSNSNNMIRHVITPHEYSRLRMTRQVAFAAILYSPVFEIDDKPRMY